jgi:hypothetical protein
MGNLALNFKCIITLSTEQTSSSPSVPALSHSPMISSPQLSSSTGVEMQEAKKNVDVYSKESENCR